MTYAWHDEYPEGNTLIPKDEEQDKLERDDEIYLEDYYYEEEAECTYQESTQYQD